MRELKCVIFDLDGVLTDTAHYHFLAWSRLANEIEINFDIEMNQKLKGISRTESLELLLGDKSLKYDESTKQKFLNLKNDYYLEYIQKIGPKDLFDNVDDLIKEIKLNNIKIVLGSASKNAKLIIEKLCISEYFDYVVDADKIKKGKPNPEIFLKGSEKVGILPRNCIVVEDSIAGITAAISANMFSVGIGTREQLKAADDIYEATGKMNLELIEKNMSKRYMI